jgi:hypothetical protein
METVEFSRIGKSDLHTDPEPFEVRLGDGRVYTMPPVDVGYWWGDATTRALLSSADPTGVLKRLTDGNRGLWRHGGGGHWWDISGQVYNVQAFGARGTGLVDDYAACQTAIDAAEETGGTVLFPPGIYLLSAGLTVAADDVFLQGTGRRSVLRAAASLTDMVSFSISSARGDNGGCRNLVLDGATFAQWAFAVDGWDGLYIGHNMAFNCTRGFLHTDFTGGSNFDNSFIEANIARGVVYPNFGVPSGGHNMPYFFYTAVEHFSSDTVHRRADSLMFYRNIHTNFGPGTHSEAMSVFLNATGRMHFYYHEANPASNNTVANLVRIRNNATSEGDLGGCGGSVFLDMQSENTFSGFVFDIDMDYTGSTVSTDGIRIIGGTHEETDLVKLTCTGTNGLLRRTLIDNVDSTLTGTDQIVISDTRCQSTEIRQREVGGQLHDAVSDSGSRTYINGMITNTALAKGEAPSASAMEVGDLYVNAADGAVWTKSEQNVPLHLGGYTSVKRLEGWVSDSTQAADLGDVPTDAYILAAHLQVTEAFNSDGTDMIRCGTSANGQQIFADVDVASTGIKTVTLGASAGHQNSARDVHVTYNNGGSEPSTGKALVIVTYCVVSDEPA